MLNNKPSNVTSFSSLSLSSTSLAAWNNSLFISLFLFVCCCCCCFFFLPCTMNSSYYVNGEGMSCVHAQNVILKISFDSVCFTIDDIRLVSPTLHIIFNIEYYRLMWNTLPPIWNFEWNRKKTHTKLLAPKLCTKHAYFRCNPYKVLTRTFSSLSYVFEIMYCVIVPRIVRNWYVIYPVALAFFGSIEKKRVAICVQINFKITKGIKFHA